MSAKNMDPHNRFRSKTVSFRMSPEEAARLDQFVAVSGMSKQDYLIHRCLQEEIVVHANPRVHKALRTRMEKILEELQRVDDGGCVDAELLEALQIVTGVWEALDHTEHSE